MFNRAIERTFPYFAHCALILVLAGIAVYGMTLDYGFVYDDWQFISVNQTIRSFSTVIDYFNSGFPLNRLTTLFTFALNYKMSGLNAPGYHCVNLFIHLLAVFSVWWLARLVLCEMPMSRGASFSGDVLRRRHWMAFFVALLFCVHPVQTQAVTYITQRFSSLATLFYVLSVSGYIRFRLAASQREKTRYMSVFVLAGLLAMTSKEESVSLFLMILAIEAMFFEGLERMVRVRRNLIIAAAGSVIFVALFSLLFKMQLFDLLNSRIISEAHDGDVLTLGTYLLTQMKVFTIFLRLCVWPFPQSFDYDLPMAKSLFDAGAMLGAFWLLFLACVAFRFRKTWPLLSLGIIWFLVTFSANLFPRANIIWEHKIYLLSFGFMLFLVVGLDALIRRARFLFLVLGIIAVFWGGAAFLRNHVWASDLSLWEDAVVHAPGKARTNNNLVAALLSKGDFLRAEYYISRVLAIAPDDPKFIMSIAAAYFYQQKYEKAIDFCDRRIRLQPLHLKAFYFKAKAYEMLSNVSKAEEIYNDALKATEGDLRVYIWRAAFFLEHQELQKAQDDYILVLKFDPVNADALIGLSDLSIARGDQAQAAAYLDQAVKLNPQNENVFIARAMNYYRQGNAERSKADIARAYQINPDHQFFSSLK